MKYLSLLFIVVIGVSSCKKPEEQEFDRGAMLSNIASSHIIPEYQSLSTNLSNLNDAAVVFTDAPSNDNLISLRESYLTTNLNFQRVKMFDFGPAEDYTLKAALNTYPVSTSKIEANIASGSYILGSAANTDAIGFPALDYLLFSGSNVDVINRFSTDENAANAITLLKDLIVKMSEEVDLVLNEWNNSYKSAFIASNGTDVGSSISLMFNEFVKDVELVKNAKIGIPGGQFSGGELFPEQVEALYSGYSQLLAIENMTALKRLYKGGSGSGFDDYMKFVDEQSGSPVSSSEIEAQFDTCIEHISGLGDPFSEDIPTNFSGFSATFQELKKLVAYAKTDMTAALGVLITFSDTDGD